MSLTNSIGLHKFVPTRDLKLIINKYAPRTISLNSSKNDLVEHIETLKTRIPGLEQELSNLLNKYKFGGKGSRTWGIPIKPGTFTNDELTQLISSKYEVNPFLQEIRPELNKNPSLNKADWLTDSLLSLEFVSSGKCYKVEDKYEIRTITPTKRLNVQLKLYKDTFFIECKGDIQDVRRLHNSVSGLLSIPVEPLEFTNQDIAFIKKELNARKKSATHKMSSGDFDVISLSASPNIGDLDVSSNYSRDYGDADLREILCQFSYMDSEQNIDVTIKISSKGSIWFLTEVPDEVIDYVFSIVRKIKPIISV